MPLYTFFLQAGPDAIPGFELEWLDHPHYAEAYARRLLRDRLRYSAVTVADGDIEIARLTRESVSAAASAGL